MKNQNDECCGQGCCGDATEASPAMSNSCPTNLSTLFLRLALAALLLPSGIEKIIGLADFVTKVSGSFANTLLPMAVVTGFLYVVPFIEVVLGALLLLGLFTRIASYASAALFIVFIFGLSISVQIAPITLNFICLFVALWIAKNPCSPLSLGKFFCKK